MIEDRSAKHAPPGPEDRLPLALRTDRPDAVCHHQTAGLGRDYPMSVRERENPPSTPRARERAGAGVFFAHAHATTGCPVARLRLRTGEDADKAKG